jgi:hypothetical protein
VIASLCWTVGRIEAAVGYSEAGQTTVGNDRDEVPFGIHGWIHGWLGSAYQFIGQPERAVVVAVGSQPRRDRDIRTVDMQRWPTPRS